MLSWSVSLVSRHFSSASINVKSDITKAVNNAAKNSSQQSAVLPANNASSNEIVTPPSRTKKRHGLDDFFLQAGRMVPLYRTKALEMYKYVQDRDALALQPAYAGISDEDLQHAKNNEEITGEPTRRVQKPELLKETDLPATGRAWLGSELRQKSFQDLHALWWVLLRERNRIATAEFEAKRLGLEFTDLWADQKCRLTMSRIKTVLTERQREYWDAIRAQEKASLPRKLTPAEEEYEKSVIRDRRSMRSSRFIRRMQNGFKRHCVHFR